jgi:hypothetical protein
MTARWSFRGNPHPSEASAPPVVYAASHRIIAKLTSCTRETVMKAFVLACVAAIVIAAAGVVVLNGLQEPVQQAFSTSAVRL